MTDIHSHILPGVDDGSSSMEMTKNILAAYVAEGVGKIVCTPHQGQRLQRADVLKSRFAELKEVAKAYPVELSLGAEIYYYDGMTEDLSSGALLTMNDTKYVLIEFSTRADIAYIPDAAYALSIAGYVPIIAHIERYPYIGKDEYFELRSNGALIQVNSSSFEKKEYAKTLKLLLKNEMVDFIGSDCHNDSRRIVNFAAAKKYIQKKFPHQFDKFFGDSNIIM